MATVEFLFDFGSPNAYFAHKVLPGIAERTGAEVKPVPVLLGGIFKATNNQPPMMAFKDIKGKMANEQREIVRFVARHGLTAFKFNPNFPILTLHVMRGAIYAEQTGFLAAYMDAVFAHMWEEEKKMDDPEVIEAALANSGLPAAEIMAATGQPEIKQALIANTEAAVARGVFGAPSFFVGDELYFGKNTLWEVEEALAARADA
ncbi:MAG: 2-hydroxychromene-2-carboxylate isomerase [Pseudomonadota bacterium]